MHWNSGHIKFQETNFRETQIKDSEVARLDAHVHTVRITVLNKYVNTY